MNAFVSRRRAAVVAVAILVFLFFVPVVQVPAYSGKSIGPPITVWVSLSHYLLGVGGILSHNDLRTGYPYNYADL